MLLLHWWTCLTYQIHWFQNSVRNQVTAFRMVLTVNCKLKTDYFLTDSPFNSVDHIFFSIVVHQPEENPFTKSSLVQRKNNYLLVLWFSCTMRPVFKVQAMVMSWDIDLHLHHSVNISTAEAEVWGMGRGNMTIMGGSTKVTQAAKFGSRFLPLSTGAKTDGFKMSTGKKAPSNVSCQSRAGHGSFLKRALHYHNMSQHTTVYNYLCKKGHTANFLQHILPLLIVSYTLNAKLNLNDFPHSFALCASAAWFESPHTCWAKPGP